MYINKKILLIALGISFNSAIMSMQLNLDFLGKGIYITQFARDTQHKTEPLLLLGQWLCQERKNFTEIDSWNLFVENQTQVILCQCPCLENKKTINVRDAVREIARTMQPGEDCSQLLVDRAQQAIRDLNEAHNFVKHAAQDNEWFASKLREEKPK